MPNPIVAKFVSTIQGKTCQGILTPTPIALNLQDQDAHNQLTVTVEPGDVGKIVTIPTNQGPAGSEQTFFLLTSTESVQIELNGVPELTYNIAKDGFWGFSGLPEVSQVSFTSVTSESASVFITKIVGDQILAVPAGGGAGLLAGALRLEDVGPAAAAQTVFALPSTPTNPTAAVLFVAGVQYSSPTFFTIVGSTLTWLDVPFAMAGGERVEVLYQ